MSASGFFRFTRRARGTGNEPQVPGHRPRNIRSARGDRSDRSATMAVRAAVGRGICGRNRELKTSTTASAKRKSRSCVSEAVAEVWKASGYDGILSALRGGRGFERRRLATRQACALRSGSGGVRDSPHSGRSERHSPRSSTCAFGFSVRGWTTPQRDKLLNTLIATVQRRQAEQRRPYYPRASSSRRSSRSTWQIADRPCRRSFGHGISPRLNRMGASTTTTELRELVDRIADCQAAEVGARRRAVSDREARFSAYRTAAKGPCHDPRRSRSRIFASNLTSSAGPSRSSTIAPTFLPTNWRTLSSCTCLHCNTKTWHPELGTSARRDTGAVRAGCRSDIQAQGRRR